jgi:hypothetical protein
MKDGKRGVALGIAETALGLAFVAAYIRLVHFLYSLGARTEIRLWWIKWLPVVLMNLTGWCLWIWYRRSRNATWRRVFGWLSLLGSSLAICLPILAFKYDVFVFTRRGGDLEHSRMLPVSAAPHVGLILRFCLFLYFGSLFLGFVAPKQIRLAVVLGGFAGAWFLMSNGVMP